MQAYAKTFGLVLVALAIQFTLPTAERSLSDDLSSSDFTATTNTDSIVSRAFTVTTDTGSIVSRAFTVTTDTGSIVSRAFTVTTDTGSIVSRAFTVTTDAGSIVSRAITVASDCNGNGIPDQCDIDCGAVGGVCDLPGCGTSVDCNGNGIPDECEIDCNNNGISDDCDITNGSSIDVFDNMTGMPGMDGIPDECINWSDGAPNTLWTDAANWEAGVVPGIGVPTNVESPGINLSGTIVDLDINASVDSLILGVNSTLNISMADLTIDSPNGIQNEGIFNINDGFSVIAASPTRLTGMQPIRLRGPTASISSAMLGDTLTSQVTIRGQGIIDADFVNDVAASVIATSGGILQIADPTMPKVNNGLFRATTGGTLLTDTTITGTGSYRANGGTIQVLPGAGGVSIGGATMDARSTGVDFGVVEVAGDASVNLTGTVTIADGGLYRGQVGAFGSLNADSAAVTGTVNGGQMRLSGNMSAAFTTMISVDGSALPCGPLRGCTPPILSMVDMSSLQAASMDVLAGRVDLSGGSLTITGPITIDAGGAVRADSADPLDTFSAGSIAVNNTFGGERLEFGGTMGVSVSGNLSVTGCGAALRGCTPPILRIRGTPVVSVGGDISIAGSAQVNVTAGPSINLAGDFDNRSTDPMIFDWATGPLTMDGVSQVFELAGEDRGVSAAGFVDNFAMGTLRVEAGTIVDFLDGFDNIPGAGCEVLYVDTLSLGAGSTIRLNGCFIFYRNLVDEGATIDLAGGGALVCSSPGDVNCDGMIDINDADAMVSAMLNPSANPQNTTAADLNGDGTTDGNDIQTMVNILLGI